MARDGNTPGSATVSRLAGRLDRSALSRRSMPGGGEVYSGDVASRALKAVGARAMTLDRSIVVSEDFDPSKPEDQALYAHELYHAEHGDGSGGGGGSNFRDAEETAARAVESMVLQRAMDGGYEAGYRPGAGASPESPHAPADKHGRMIGAGGLPGGGETQQSTGQSQPDPAAGYNIMASRGYTHSDIVDQLARQVIQAIDERQEVKMNRNGDRRGAF